MRDLIQQVRAFRRERDWEQYHSPKNLVMALVVEVAELAEHFQWLTQEQSRTLPSERLDAIRQEIGDVLIYLANLCDMLGIDPVRAAHDKLEINRQKYPAAKARGKADKYNRYE